jgi:hypothetical protein
MKQQRKHYTPEEKIAILRHLLDKEPISQFCDELGLQSTQQALHSRERYGKGTSTTAGFPAISGWRTGRSRPPRGSIGRTGRFSTNYRYAGRPNARLCGFSKPISLVNCLV